MELVKKSDKTRVNTSQHVLAKRDFPGSQGTIDKELIELAEQKRKRKNQIRINNQKETI